MPEWKPHDPNHRIVPDAAAHVPGVKRRVPGDCWCLDCHAPLSAWWNNGHPQAIEDPEYDEDEDLEA